MLLNDAVANRQPQARTPSRPLGGKERLKDLGEILPFDSLTCIGKLNHHLVAAVGIRACGHGQSAFLLQRVYGVDHQGEKHLDQLFGIRGYLGQRLSEAPDQMNATESIMVFDEKECVLDDAVDGRGPLGLGLRIGKVQQSIDDVLAPIQLRSDDAEIFLEATSRRRREILETQGQCLTASTDRRQRIVDLMHDPRRELADGRQFLRLRNLLLNAAPFSNVFAYRYYVGDLVFVEPHRDLADAVVPELAERRAFDLHLLHLAGRKDAVEFFLEKIPRLATHYLKDFTAENVVPGNTSDSYFALAVPRLDTVVPVDHIEAHRKRIDDLRGEKTLEFGFSGPVCDLGGEVFRQFDRRKPRRQYVGNDAQNAALYLDERFVSNRGFEQADRFAPAEQRQANVNVAGSVPERLILHPRTHCLQAGVTRNLGSSSHDRPIPCSSLVFQPDTAILEIEVAPQSSDDARQHFLRPYPRLEKGRNVGQRG